MKHVIALLLCAGLFAVSPSFAELPSCDELAELADILDEVNDELDRIGRIPEDSELDQALGEVVTALEDVAKIEDSKKLSKSVAALAKAWEALDWDSFQVALDEVVLSFDKIRRAECD